jgi:group I intron endonuclease
MFRIYLITNSVNDKKYVGQTITTIVKRWQRHCWASEAGKGMIITRAIHKYGKECFNIVQIDTAHTLEEANEKEVRWGLHHNCITPHGYNAKLGGRKTVHCSEATKHKLSAINTGKRASAATIEKLSRSHMGHIASADTRQKMSDYWKGKPTHSNTKRGASLKKAKTYVLLDPDGNEVTITNMRRFCMAHDLWASSMCELCTGKIAVYKGWRLVKVLGCLNQPAQVTSGGVVTPIKIDEEWAA